MAKKEEPIAAMTFEQAQKELEDVINTLESEPVDLQSSVALFERGKMLVQHCQQLLTEAELKVTQLQSDGTMKEMDQ